MSYDRPAMPLPNNMRNARFDRPPVPPPYVASKPHNSAPALPPRPLPSATSTNNEDILCSLISRMPASIQADNIFQSAISTDQPLSVFSRVSHPVPLPANTTTNGKATETNKFYGNMMIGDQTNPAWTHPYSFFWSKDSYFGMAVSYINASQRVFGPNSPPEYFFGPGGIKSFVFGAVDFTSADQMSLGFTNLTHLQAHVQVKKNNNQFILIPLVQGMGFATAVYYNMIPQLFSAVGYKSVAGATSPRSGIQKYKIVLQNNVTWSLYVTVPSGQSLALALANNNQIVGNKSVNGCIFQLVPDTNSAIDAAAGCYPNSGTLSGSVSGSTGQYTIAYGLSGSSNGGKTLMYACPHHVKSFTSAMSSKRINSSVDSVTMGQMTGYLTDTFELQVNVPSNIGFDPYSAIPGKSSPNYSNDVLNAIKSAAQTEALGDVVNESNVDSMYFGGKILAKYAWILYCCQYVIKDSSLVQTLTSNLKNAFGRFIGNTQILPLRYDTTWGGIISSGQSTQDFGNSYYNDHHFHYGYHVIAAAILAKVDRDNGGNWLSQNKTWVDNLVRDYSNPSSSDSYFPVFRSFDWFAGHSWAKGLFPSGDGKDEESSSEDVNAAYAIKLWGNVTGNQNLESIGNLELGIMNGSLNSYFLYLDNNTVEPSQIIPNKVSGILFENKIDHTTYFGTELQYIQMIHAIPITPMSGFIRSPVFVQQEWVEKLAAIVNNVEDGWRGILMLNRALSDPLSSYSFFVGSTFSTNYLDNGQSKTWSLTYSGAFS
ncbi:LANO_0H05402g1_1 [Lachancea nothofagi CBS 11611]|uniref:glucan endo-1,3-beta-D-glucosidase n=1 Tax=Lachancea nothofagi CBS 11611 TaxID=1266666 RepID=A0A1G4KLI7_9SACH|nr:LANO_0H05402g1_1 [Lachancea nothofagi CBS 11611]